MKQKTKNPQPLDLEDFRKWRAKTNPDLIFSISQIEFIKQRLKSACEFYLRYKDNPELLIKEHPEYKEELNKYFSSIVDDYDEKIYNNWMADLHTYTFGGQVINDFNVWLFKLAFKDVFKEGK